TTTRPISLRITTRPSVEQPSEATLRHAGRLSVPSDHCNLFGGSTSANINEATDSPGVPFSCIQTFYAPADLSFRNSSSAGSQSSKEEIFLGSRLRMGSTSSPPSHPVPSATTKPEQIPYSRDAEFLLLAEVVLLYSIATQQVCAHFDVL